MLILDHWSDMTFHMKDVIYLGGIVFSAAVAYTTIRSNKRRIEKLEKKTDNLKEVFSNFKVELVKMKYEIIEVMTKIFNRKK